MVRGLAGWRHLSFGLVNFALVVAALSPARAFSESAIRLMSTIVLPFGTNRLLASALNTQSTLALGAATFLSPTSRLLRSSTIPGHSGRERCATRSTPHAQLFWRFALMRSATGMSPLPAQACGGCCLCHRRTDERGGRIIAIFAALTRRVIVDRSYGASVISSQYFARCLHIAWARPRKTGRAAGRRCRRRWVRRSLPRRDR